MEYRSVQTPNMLIIDQNMKLHDYPIQFQLLLHMMHIGFVQWVCYNYLKDETLVMNFKGECDLA